MKPYTLKSLLGKHICQEPHIRYCHIDRIIKQMENHAICNVLVVKQDDSVNHWYITTSWTQDANGVFVIQDYEIIKEEEVYGHPTLNAHHSERVIQELG